MKKQLMILSSACLLLSSCEMEKSRGPASSQTQIGSDADRQVTEKIRQSLMDDNTLSTNAKDIKIITLNGNVSLKGAVTNEAEKANVEKKVKAVPGVKNVDNQIEVDAFEVLLRQPTDIQNNKPVTPAN